MRMGLTSPLRSHVKMYLLKPPCVCMKVLKGFTRISSLIRNQDHPWLNGKPLTIAINEFGLIGNYVHMYNPNEGEKYG